MNIAPPQIDKRRARNASAILEKAGHPVIPVIIVQKIGVPDANARGLGINEREPNSNSAGEYSELFNWIERQFK
jgi:nitrogenase subunit NifH